MGVEDLEQIIERAKENPLQAMLLVGAVLVATMLVAAAKRIGEQIGTGSNPVRGAGLVVGFLIVIATTILISPMPSDPHLNPDDGSSAGPLTQSERELLECLRDNTC